VIATRFHISSKHFTISLGYKFVLKLIRVNRMGLDAPYFVDVRIARILMGKMVSTECL
jgi:hypothetical protein